MTIVNLITSENLVAPSWQNQSAQHVIWIEEVWEIGCQGMGNTLGLNTWRVVAIKQSKYSEAVCMITLCHF